MIALFGKAGTVNHAQAMKLANIVLGQLHFMESFVEDLLNLRMIHEGYMTI